MGQVSQNQGDLGRFTGFFGPGDTRNGTPGLVRDALLLADGLESGTVAVVGAVVVCVGADDFGGGEGKGAGLRHVVLFRQLQFLFRIGVEKEFRAVASDIPVAAARTGIA